MQIMTRLQVSRRFALSVCLAVVVSTGCGDDGSNNPDADAQNDSDMSRDTAPADVADAADLPMLVPAPEHFGPHAVGFAQTTHVYDPVGPLDVREIDLLIWYPGLPNSATVPATYEVLSGQMMDVVVAERTPGYVYDEPTTAAGPFPVAVYSHMAWGHPLMAYPYAELMASWGWVVIAPAHAGNGMYDRGPTSSNEDVDIMVRRVTDIGTAIDALSDNFYIFPASFTDTETVVVLGHGKGGVTALTLAGMALAPDALLANCADCTLDAETEAAIRAGLLDPRVKAVVTQVPDAFPWENVPDGIADVGVPTMLQSASGERAGHPEVWAAMNNPEDYWLRVEDGGRYSFSPICTLFDAEDLANIAPDADALGCGPAFVDPTLAVPALADYVLAFARLHVLGEQDASDVLSGAPLLGNFVITQP